MKDFRLANLARLIVRHSLMLNSGESVLIDAIEDCEQLIIAVLDAIAEAGGNSYVLHQSLPVKRLPICPRTSALLIIFFPIR